MRITRALQPVRGGRRCHGPALLLGLLVLLAGIVTGCASESRKWEYKTLLVKPVGQADDKTGLTLTPSEAEMNQLGAEGWELMTSFAEVETAFPNFGNSEYHTGIKGNTRTSRAVLVFKRKQAR